MNGPVEHVRSDDLGAAVARWLVGEAPGQAPHRLRADVLRRTQAMPQRRWAGLPRLGLRSRGWLVATSGIVLVVIGVAAALAILSSSVPVQPSAPVTPAGSMLYPRSGHTATLLADGRVLIVGGSNRRVEPDNPSAVATAEIWDPRTRTFSAAGELLDPREGHTATLLPDGRVLVVGGYLLRDANLNEDLSRQRLAAAEFWDPDLSRFVAAPSLNEPRAEHTATALPDGRVLIAGGQSPLRPKFAELWDPSAARFVLSGEMDGSRPGSAATLLDDGRVLIAGGQTGLEPLDTALVWDSTSGSFNETGSMVRARAYPSAVSLRDGRVLFIGGSSDSGGAFDQPEAWDASTGTFTLLDMPARTFYEALVLQAVPLDDGRVALVNTVGVQIWDPERDSLEVLAPMPQRLGLATVTKLIDGRVLVAGGITTGYPGDRGSLSTTALVIDPLAEPSVATPNPAWPDTRPFQRAGRLPVAGPLEAAVPLANGDLMLLGDVRELHESCATAMTAWVFSGDDVTTLDEVTFQRVGMSTAVMPDGRVLVVGGGSGDGSSCGATYAPNALVWDPRARTVTEAGRTVNRWIETPTAVPLADGRVLLAGPAGEVDESGLLLSAVAEVWDPVTQAFTPAGAPASTRVRPSATLLGDGRVLFAGGSSEERDCAPGAFSCQIHFVPLETAEVWDPQTNSFSSAGDMGSPRQGSTATTLSDGRVLIVGGFADYDELALLATALVWDPTSSTFSDAGTMPEARPGHSATLINNGRVLISGGSSQGSLIWEPETGSFVGAGTMVEPRLYHVAVRLSDGRVAIAGGFAFDPVEQPLDTIEIFTAPSP